MAIKKIAYPESNPDPITGAPGAHPLGVGLGAAAGGVAAGAAAGTLAAGPIGTVVGAAIGAVVGGLVGKGAAESMNPTDDGMPGDREVDMRTTTSEGPHGPIVEVGARTSERTLRPAADASDGVVAGRGAGDFDVGPQATEPCEENDLAHGTRAGTFTSSVAGEGTAAHSMDDDAYWRAIYRNEPYYSSSRSYDDYAPAYRLGHQRRADYGGSYDASEQQLAGEWESAKGASRLTWTEAKQATRAAWNRLESISVGTDHLPLNRVGDSPTPLNSPPLPHRTFQSFAPDAVTPAADPMVTDTGHLSDASHEAWDQTTKNADVAGNWAFDATSDHLGAKAMHTLREAVRRRPFAAIGVATALGFLLVGGRSLQRSVSRARWN